MHVNMLYSIRGHSNQFTPTSGSQKPSPPLQVKAPAAQRPRKARFHIFFRYGSLHFPHLLLLLLLLLGQSLLPITFGYSRRKSDNTVDSDELRSGFPREDGVLENEGQGAEFQGFLGRRSRRWELRLLLVGAARRFGSLDLQTVHGVSPARKLRGRAHERRSLPASRLDRANRMENRYPWRKRRGNVMLWKQRLPVPAQLTWVSANSSLSFSFTIQSDKIALYLNSASRRYSYWEYQTHKQRNISYSLLGSTGLKIFDRGQRKMAQILVDRRMPIRFLALGKEGNLGLYHYSPQRGKFETSFRAVNATCDLPLACGRYGLCTFSNTCRCLQFTHRSNGLSNNCDEGLRNIGFCETEESLRMVELVGISSVLEGTPQGENVTKEECSRLCMKECWCAAASFSENGNGGTRRGCFLYELVVGLKQVVDRRHQSSFLIKVPDRIVEDKSGISSRTKKWLLASGTVVDIVVILLIFAGFFWYFVLRKKKRETER